MRVAAADDKVEGALDGAGNAPREGRLRLDGCRAQIAADAPPEDAAAVEAAAAIEDEAASVAPREKSPEEIAAAKAKSDEWEAKAKARHAEVDAKEAAVAAKEAAAAAAEAAAGVRKQIVAKKVAGISASEWDLLVQAGL